MGTRRRVLGALTAALLSAACAGDDGAGRALTRSADRAVNAAPSTTAAVVPASDAPATTSTSASSSTSTTAASTTTTRPPIPRLVVDTGFIPYATVGAVVLHHPAAQVERIGLHESGHDGAQQQEPAETAARPFVMESRDRGTGDRTAADIVVAPDTEIRSPVTGTVKRAGGYTLYCDHRDEYLVIDPDARPGWEVKLLHFEGLSVRAGDRVDAGVTVVAARGRVLPFESQVDEDTASPAWPHVHIEVVDPTIPDRPSPGGGCP